MALPDLTPEQRAQALEKATQARRRRAEVKNALKARSMNLSEVLELADSDEAVAKMKVVSLLESLPRVGTNTAAVLTSTRSPRAGACVASAPSSGRRSSSVSADAVKRGTLES